MSFADSAIALLVLLGALAGIMGSLGIASASIVVPALIFGLPYFGVGGPDVVKIAIATSLAVVIPSSMASAQSHAAKGAIDWGMAGVLAPGIAAGAYIAGTLAPMLNIRLIALFFVAFTLFTAWGLISQRRIALETPAVPPCFTCISVKSVLGGAVSSLLAVGVGFFVIPLLARFMPIQRAIGTSNALSWLMAFAGTASYLSIPNPAGCTTCAGYVFLPAVAAIGISAVLAAPAGVWAAHIMPAIALRRLFAAFLVFAAGSLAYKALTPAALTADIDRLFLLAGQLIQPRAALPIAADVPESGTGITKSASTGCSIAN